MHWMIHCARHEKNMRPVVLAVRCSDATDARGVRACTSECVHSKYDRCFCSSPVFWRNSSTFAFDLRCQSVHILSHTLLLYSTGCTCGRNGPFPESPTSPCHRFRAVVLWRTGTQEDNCSPVGLLKKPCREKSCCNHEASMMQVEPNSSKPKEE